MAGPSLSAFWTTPGWTAITVVQGEPNKTDSAEHGSQDKLPCGPSDAPAPSGTAPSESDRTAAKKKAAGCLTAQHMQHVLNAELDNAQPIETPAEFFIAGHAATEAVYQTGLQLTNLAAQGIAGASKLAGTGAMVTSGTITERGGRYSYSPTPRDRLIVPGPEGKAVEFKFKELQGDMRSADAFFAGRHRLTFDAKIKDAADLEISSRRQGGHREATAEGRLVVDGRSYSVDLKFDGVDSQQDEVQGMQGAKSYKITGTVVHDASKLTINERYTAQEATSEKRDGLRIGGHAISSQRVISNTLEIGEDTYVWKDVRVAESFKNGRPTSVDGYWRAQGSLTRNGEAFGEYTLNADADDVKISLQAGDRRIDLERFER